MLHKLINISTIQTRMLICLLLLLSSSVLVGQVDTIFSKSPEFKGILFSNNSPDSKPSLFAEGLINPEIHHYHSSPKFNKEMNEMYFSMYVNYEGPQRIFTSTKSEGLWSQPEVIPSLGNYSSGGPVISSDGNRLFFYSTRPDIVGDSAVANSRIWFIEKENKKWSKPKLLQISKKMGISFYPSFHATDDIFYFSAKVAPQDYDLFQCYIIDGETINIKRLNAPISLKDKVELSPFTNPDNTLLVFQANNRENRNEAVLKVCKKKEDGSWSSPVNLSEKINQAGARFGSFSPDGNYFFFTSYKSGFEQVYWMESSAIFDDRPLSVAIGKFPILKGPYLGQTLPGKVAKQFAPGIVSTDLHDDASPAFSPNLDEIYTRIVYKTGDKYYSTIFVSKEEDEGWTIPQIDDFSGKSYYGGVYISKDGNRKYVRVNNPKNGKYNLDIAVCYREEGGWTPFTELADLNTEFNEGSVFEAYGYLYWWREEMRNDPKPKLFRSKIENGEYLAMEQVIDFPEGALVDVINDEKGYAIMSMKLLHQSRDLFVSFKNESGKWLTPVNLGKDVNSKSTEKAASLSPDGKYLFFVSNRKENLNPKRIWDHPYFIGEQEIWKTDIYWVDASVIEELRPEN